MDPHFHPLHTDTQPPLLFTYPFCYTPHPLCVAAATQVQRYIRESGVCQGERGGKMFGVLVVEHAYAGGLRQLGFLAAYSGLLGGRNDWRYFVPPVFDAQQPDGHFKTVEREISAINRQLYDMQHDPMYLKMKATRDAFAKERGEAIDRFRADADAAKRRRDERRRDERRRSGEPISEAERTAMTRESQFLKAELRRMRKDMEERLADFDRRFSAVYTDRMAELRERRRRMSDDLQLWLFGQYRMLNANGVERTLVDIFNDYTHALPPAGAGDCCAPKLLQYAYSHGLRPVCMAEFWWGEPPAHEVRHHMAYYPACRSKCLPILTHMLQGLDVEPNPLAQPVAARLEIVYEDAALAVVVKPAGMLSVPGKEAIDSVESIMRRRWHIGGATPIMPHRLDKDTSGLLVVARTADAYRHLQRQFAGRLIAKRYEAVVDGIPAQREGTVALPLAPDISDRPRQHVDFGHGKPATTFYRVVATANGHALVWLYPHTGRTHQLRVHCAHPAGLACPILGDPLYGRGTATGRMYLHAAQLQFTHPATGKKMEFEAPSGFMAQSKEQKNL